MLISEYKLKDIEASGVMVLWLNDLIIDSSGKLTYTKAGIDSFYKMADEAYEGLVTRFDGKYTLDEILK